MAVNIFIARHGQNEDNARGILNGHRDLPLTDLGRQQAQDLSEGIREKGLQFTKVYSSPLVRAHETASIVSRNLGLDAPETIPELVERDFGIMTGRPHSDIERICAPDILKTNTITYFLSPEGAETFPQLIERAHKLLGIVRSKYEDGNILLVTHGDFGKMIYTAATGKDWKKVLTDFHFGNGDLIEITPNDNAHLIRLPQHNL